MSIQSKRVIITEFDFIMKLKNLKPAFCRFEQQLYLPVFSNILQNRWLVFLLVSIYVVFVVLSSLGYDVWHCPIRTALGVPCPGCGLSSATICLFQGNLKAAFSQHAFSVVFFIGLILATGVSLLPSSKNKIAINWINQFERRTGLFTYLMLALIIYWIMRLRGWL
jgi:hypothetical protein